MNTFLVSFQKISFNIKQFVFILSIILVGGFVINISTTHTATNSISIITNSETITLDVDADVNTIANIGDTVLVQVILDNTDGGCVISGTTVTANLQKYGGGSAEVLTCVDNGGVSDVFSKVLLITDAGASGIDVATSTTSSKVTLTYSDSDDTTATTSTAVLAAPVDTIVPTVTALGTGSTDYVLSLGGTVDLTFNDTLSSAGKTLVEQAISASANYDVGSFTWSTDAQLTILGNSEFDITFLYDTLADVTDAAGNQTSNLRLINSALKATEQEGGGSVEVSTDGNEVIITDDDAATTVTIGAGVDDVVIDFDNLVTDGVGMLPDIDITAMTSIGEIIVDMPDDITVTGDTTWTGWINAPQVLSDDSVTGVDGDVSDVIEIGAGNIGLQFDKGIRLVFSDKAGRAAGFSHGGAFTVIDLTCASDSQATGNALPAGEDCKINVGDDLIIWTKHFSSFVLYTPSPPPVQKSSGSGWTPPLPTEPTGGYKFFINPDTSTTSTLTLYFDGGPDANQISISENPDFSSAKTINYSPSTVWVISGTTGKRKLYVKFVNKYKQSSKVLSATVMYVPLTHAEKVQKQIKPIGEKLQKLMRARFIDVSRAVSRNPKMSLNRTDIIALQKFIIAQNKGSSAVALRKAGPTGNFGKRTRAALAEYQAIYNLKPANGYFNSATQEHLKSIGF